MPEVADSHVHLDDARFDQDRPAVLERARHAGVILAIVPAVDRESWSRIHALTQAHDDLQPAYGLHPMFLSRHRREDLDALEHWLDDHPAVALGEIGLDFHDEVLDPEEQRRYFEAQLQLAQERDLPVIIHARKAVQDVTLALRRIGGLRGVIHSFSGSPEQARQLYELGFHIGFGGPVTYPRARRLRRLVAEMPLEHLLLETDAPDQPIAGHQGERNEPARVADVLQCIAQLRDEDPQAIAAQTTANARRLFRLR